MGVLDEIKQDWKKNKTLAQKIEIQEAARQFQHSPLIHGKEVRLGDDTAAIPDADGYLLFAAEGVWPPLLQADPQLAGRSCMLANLNDVYAMGGRPLAVVDVLLHTRDLPAEKVFRGIQENAERYGVPVVGGHSTRTEDVSSLAVCILGKAKKLLCSHTARSGDYLMMAGSFQGSFRRGFDFWDCSSTLDQDSLRYVLEILPLLAERDLCDTAKDISMAGLLGTLVMLLESSGKGADIQVKNIPHPKNVDFCRWLRAFHSYGFILSVRPENVAMVQVAFEQRGLFCGAFGRVTEEPRMMLHDGDEACTLWENEALTGFGIARSEV